MTSKYLLDGVPVSPSELIIAAREQCRYEDEMQAMERDGLFFTSSCAALLRRKRNGGHEVNEVVDSG